MLSFFYDLGITAFVVRCRVVSGGFMIRDSVCFFCTQMESAQSVFERLLKNDGFPDSLSALQLHLQISTGWR